MSEDLNRFPQRLSRTKYDRSTGWPPVPRAAPLLRFRSLPRHPHCESFFQLQSTIARPQKPATSLPNPSHFHLQSFSPSWRLAPHSALPVCFTRQTRMGFTLQSLPLSHSRYRLSTIRALLSLQIAMRTQQPTRLQGFVPCESPLTITDVSIGTTVPLLSWDSPSPGLSPSSSWPRFHEASSLEVSFRSYVGAHTNFP